jgi:inorganic triphosphatase YgiF
MMEEIEIKIALPARRLKRLRESEVVASARIGPARRQRLRSIYFDTPERDLARAGAALRIREAEGRRVQTLKMPLAERAVAQAFREFEVPVDADVPCLDGILDSGARRLLTRRSTLRRLVPVFTTEIEREVVEARFSGSDIEIAFDRGVIRGGRRRMTVNEAELELKSGSRGHLFELALALHRVAPLRLESRTKSERGYLLADKGRPASARARPIELEKGATARAAFAAIARNGLMQVRANEAALQDGSDPEGVHQMRVAVRRLRALVSCYRNHLAADVRGPLSAGLRWLQQQLGPARDWDVFLDGTLLPMRRHVGADAALAAACEEAEGLRGQAYRAARKALAEPRYTEFLLTFGLWLENGTWAEAGADALDRPARLFASEILSRRHRALRKHGGKRAESMSEADLHRLRILDKKLRYAIEFYRSLYPPKPIRRYLDSLIEIQDCLGAINDSVVSRALVRQIEERLAPKSASDAARTAGAVLGWEAARIRDDLQGFRAIWRRYRALDGFW